MIIARHIVNFTESRIKAIRCFRISASRRKSHDVLAQFRPPRPPSSLCNVAESIAFSGRTSADRSEVFETSSTEPAGTFFQEVPPPTKPQEAEYLALPVPAVKDTPLQAGDGSKEKKNSPSRGPITVLGVVVPPKPRPPGEEGKSISLILTVKLDHVPSRPWQSFASLPLPFVPILAPCLCASFPRGDFRCVADYLVTDCCMSGCVHCVFTIYADDLELYFSAISAARAALISADVSKADWPDEVRGVDGLDERGVVEREKRRVEEGMDSCMTAFLA